MGMDVYVWAKHSNAPDICIMQWRKPYAFATWLLEQLPDDERAIVDQDNSSFSVLMTADLLARAIKDAEAAIQSNAPIESDDYHHHSEIWHALTDCNFEWRAQRALEAGYRIEIYMSP